MKNLDIHNGFNESCSCYIWVVVLDKLERIWCALFCLYLLFSFAEVNIFIIFLRWTMFFVYIFLKKKIWILVTVNNAFFYIKYMLMKT